MQGYERKSKHVVSITAHLYFKCLFRSKVESPSGQQPSAIHFIARQPRGVMSINLGQILDNDLPRRAISQGRDEGEHEEHHEAEDYSDDDALSSNVGILAGLSPSLWSTDGNGEIDSITKDEAQD